MITFCGYSNRSSGIIRGRQLSQYLDGSDFIDVDRLDWKKPKNDIILYVRKFDENHIKHCKKLGLKVGFEVSDNPVADYITGRVKKDDFSRYTHPLIDFYVVNNDVVKNEMLKHTSKSVYVIPHHNCNFKRIIREPREPKNLGYIGLPEQSIAVEAMLGLCQKFNLNFIKKDVVDFKKLDDAFSEIDIGIVFFEKNESKKELQEKILKYKPNTKLSNFQSYGIPTVCIPYESFKQFGEQKCIFVEDMNQVDQAVENLISDRKLYDTLSNEGVKVSEKLHIENVIEYYRTIKEDMKND